METIRPLNRRITVQPNDSLWKIAFREYGDGRLWPQVAKNNGLRTPNLVFAGQQLEMPDVHRPNESFGSPYSAAQLSSILPPEAKQVAYPAYQFKFDNVDLLPPVPGPGYHVRFQLAGDLVAQKKGTLKAFQITNLKEIAAVYETEYKSEFAKLSQDFKFAFDSDTKKLKLSGGITHTLRFEGKEWSSYSVDIEPNKITFTFSPTPVSGTMARDIELKGTLSYKVVVEGDGIGATPALQPVRNWAPRPIQFTLTLNDVVLAMKIILVVAIGAVILFELAALAVVLTIAFATLLLFLPTSSGPVPGTVPSI